MACSSTLLLSGSVDEFSDGDEFGGSPAQGAGTQMLSWCERVNDDSSDEATCDADSDQDYDLAETVSQTVRGALHESLGTATAAAQEVHTNLADVVLGAWEESVGTATAAAQEVRSEVSGVVRGALEDLGTATAAAQGVLGTATSAAQAALAWTTSVPPTLSRSGRSSWSSLIVPTSLRSGSQARHVEEADGEGPSESKAEAAAGVIASVYNTQAASASDVLREEVQALRAKLTASEDREAMLAAALAWQQVPFREPYPATPDLKELPSSSMSSRDSVSVQPPTSSTSSKDSGTAATQQLPRPPVTLAVPRLNFLYSSPVSVRGLNVPEEILVIERSFAGAVQVEASIASADSLKRALNEQHGWLHISMHSVVYNGMPAFVLEEPLRAVGKLFTEKQLEELISSGGGAASAFVFLSACQSERLAHVLKAAGVKHVVCCRSQVGDRQAISFAQNLYHAMAQRRSLREAFDGAVCSARATGDQTVYSLLSDGFFHLEPRLVVHLQVPQRYLQQAVPPGLWKAQAPRACLEPLTLPTGVEDFVGREAILDTLVYQLHLRRIILLQCEEPHGRTATLRQVARFLAMPGRFGAEKGCAFFPGVAIGGLLLVDDVEALSDMDRHRVRRHLLVSGARVLAACRYPMRDPFGCGDKAICVPLSPLKPLEAAELFLRRIHRPLFLADFLPADALHAFKALDLARPVPKEEALQRLLGLVTVFAGDPGLVRRAADVVGPGTPRLHGNLWSLATGTTRRAPSK